uniref:Uncharacterized protein n=1 Tax=Oryza sativa subsp. japonica TaxID=39947 RepID=Q6K6E0_ORYSJ|nr:hypothetical protein [Oryza sativa Japonica Group]
MSVFVIIIGYYTAIDWITDIVIFINILSNLFIIAYSTAIDRQLRHHPSTVFIFGKSTSETMAKMIEALSFGVI